VAGPPDQRFTHVAVTVARECFQAGARRELLAFYGDVFGWFENEALARPGERILLRAPTDRQYVTVRASDAPMATSGYEHLGFEVPTSAELQALHARAAAYAERDSRVELGEIKTSYGGRLEVFRVRYLLPLTIEVQFFSSPRRD
jgi:hypothetical protein